MENIHTFFREIDPFHLTSFWPELFLIYLKTYTSPDAKTLDPDGKGFGRETLAGLEGPLEGDGVPLGPLVMVKPGLLLFIKLANVRLLGLLELLGGLEVFITVKEGGNGSLF